MWFYVFSKRVMTQPWVLRRLLENPPQNRAFSCKFFYTKALFLSSKQTCHIWWSAGRPWTLHSATPATPTVLAALLGGQAAEREPWLVREGRCSDGVAILEEVFAYRHPWIVSTDYVQLQSEYRAKGSSQWLADKSQVSMFTNSPTIVLVFIPCTVKTQ